VTEASARERDRSRLGPRGLSALFAAYLAISVAITWPMTRDMGSLIVGDPGDPVLNASILLWSATTTPFSSAWWNAPHYYPAQGVAGFTENLVGLSPFATPVYWLTRNPILAYNFALFLTWPLSAIAVFLLVRSLTDADDAAWLAGLAYAFTPIRAPGIGHIQTLAAYGLPVMLLGLHGYLKTRRWPWLLLAGAAWVQQSLANGYFMLFGAVLIGAWLLYFCGLHLWKRGVAMVAALAIASLPLVPIMLEYWRIHERYGLHRAMGEILYFSATPASWLEVSPLVWLWRWVFNEGKDNLFPGVTALALVMIAASALVSRGSADARQLDTRGWGLRIALAALFGIAAVALGVRIALGPVDTTVLSIPVRMRSADRALGLLLLSGVPLAVIVAPRLRDALRRRSPFVFYAGSAVVLALLCCGPILRVGDDVLLSRAPYGWLMMLPGFNELRIPTQFKVPAILCLSIAAGLAYPTVRPTARRFRLTSLLVISVGLLIDGWMLSVPMAAAPALIANLEPADRAEPILELPLGPAWDASATFRAATHRRRTFNGVSGYEPPHYFALETGLRARDPGMLAAIASLGTFDAVVDREADGDGAIARYVAASPGAVMLAEDDRHFVYRIPQGPAEPEMGTPVSIRRIEAPRFEPDWASMYDDRIETGWTSYPYEPAAQLVVDLGDVREIAGVSHATGDFARNFPGELAIDVSTDARSWERAWRGSTAASAFLAYVREPRIGRLRIVFPPRQARYVRLRQLDSDQRIWRVSEITVHAPRPGALP
jgi:F5/8 type C domain-containing protein